MPEPERDYDVFQKLSDGGDLWQCSVNGVAAASEVVRKLGRVTKNEVFAMCISTAEIVARANEAKERSIECHRGTASCANTSS
jgi:hypothetical protein